MSDDPLSLENLYKQGTLDSASVPRVLLMLYDKLLLLLKSVHGCWQTEQKLAHSQLIQAHDILSHMMVMFMHSEAQAYHELHRQHEVLAQELTQLFQLPADSAVRLSRLREALETQRRAWRSNMKLKKRVLNAPPPLNVKRKQASSDGFAQGGEA